jgi:hypothetical protein
LVSALGTDGQQVAALAAAGPQVNVQRSIQLMHVAQVIA